ncbi:MAG: aminomethyl-transferring glycine dehydrogenase subunit GcvPA [Lentisphaerae bacterium]|nr:aminomethyl-transferring glycine dehydrogenase subunit GcvPA [Lentisphaerota bacterium]MCP4101609.1 aminomethyl-transferring glycine dehydrogenase subunit GcvPA [Lentisphaerota bacterium]
MPYIANTQADREEMFKRIGCADFAEMWRQAQVTVPEPSLDKLPHGLSEFEVVSNLKNLAAKNASELVNFLGAGYYDHIIPAAVSEITSRTEFYTAYTPYQPEASQGTLQAIYEYQSMICRLTGMPVANASLYDGGTALFEAMMMSVRATRRRQVVISEAVSPIFRKMIECYSTNLDIELISVPAGIDDSNQQALLDAVTDATACVMVQYPNVFGTIEDWAEFTDKVHVKKAMAVCSTYPIALALLTPPGELGFDIVTGEGQSMGIPLSFGGPYLGFMSVTQKLMRKMPGRICGRALSHTTDSEGHDGFVLTLQAREQHIRRESAMSNICTNENLCALSALVYLSCIGKQGLIDVAQLCASKAVFAREQLLAIKGVEPVGGDAFFNEFVIKLPTDAGEVVGKMIDKGFAPGFPLGRYYDDRRDQLLVAVTEKRTREEIKALANALEGVLWN